MTDYIPRPLYIDRIRPFIGKSLIKVLTGQRRVGKSYLLMQIMDLIKEGDPGIKIIYINKELHEYSSISNAEDLFSFLRMMVDNNEKVALLIDEVQDIEAFEVVLRDLVTRKNYDIYCTGSNARLLSGELATVLSGRYIEVKVYGLSYGEYQQFHKLPDNSETFLEYARNGGLPYLVNLSNEQAVVNEYLKSIYNTILLKDVVARFNVRNVGFLEKLVEFLAGNVGSLVSSKRISEYLRSQKINISTQVVIDYLGYLETSFLIFKVKRSGIQGKKIFEIGEKYFFEDTGLRNSICGFTPDDYNKLLENIVYLHLRIAGYEVTVGQDGDREVDFIATKGGERIYVQVAYLLESQKTIEREFGNLQSITDNYPKYVVSMDEMNETGTYEGIKRLHIRDFCMNILNNT